MIFIHNIAPLIRNNLGLREIDGILRETEWFMRENWARVRETGSALRENQDY
jgi:hypothetical protein